MSRPLSWEAQRRGEIYCAPACGANCTYKAYQAATERTAALCLRLGAGWKPRVWENLGWHYAAISSCGRLKVAPPVRAGDVYCAFLGMPDVGISGRWCRNGSTPEAAVLNVIKAGRAALVETRTIVDGFETVLIGLKGVKRRAKLRLYQGRPSSKRSLKG